jgi:hypothetical protein
VRFIEVAGVNGLELLLNEEHIVAVAIGPFGDDGIASVTVEYTTGSRTFCVNEDGYGQLRQLVGGAE